jgi:hypothetical protein
MKENKQNAKWEIQRTGEVPIKRVFRIETEGYKHEG